MNARDASDCAERSQSISVLCWIGSALVLNAALCWLGYLILGGSAFFVERHQEESYLRTFHGWEEFPVSDFVSWYSVLHALSVFVSLPMLVIIVPSILYQWVRLRLLRSRIRKAQA